jgi:hypothetical protein
MHPTIADKVKYGQGSRVFAVLDDADRLRMVCLGEFNEVRYRFNQMACLAGAMLMTQLQDAAGISSLASATLQAEADAGRAPCIPPAGAWTDRLTLRSILSPAKVFALAGAAPSDAADTIGAMVRLNDWPQGTEALKGTKHLCTSMSEIGDLFFGSKDHPVVRAGRAQERSAVRRVEDALDYAKRSGFGITDETGLRQFMDRYAGAKHLQLIHTVDID